MNFGGMVENSFVDFPGKIACVFFTTGCNLACWYCHNSALFTQKPTISESEALEFLKTHRGFLDGVVVSGGEPTLQPDLKSFLKKIKDMDYLVKLDTNGTDPETLIDIVKSGLVDYVAMDYKAPMKKYEMVVEKTKKLAEIVRSREFLLNGNIDYEFRTTFSGDLTLEDLEDLVKELKGAKNFSLQKCKKVDFNEINLPERTREELNEAIVLVKRYIPNAILKGA